MRKILVLAAAITAAFMTTGAGAQVADQGAAPTVNVFLDCQTHGCDSSHFRTEIPFVNWVRDRTEADVHLLITAQETGGGGIEYTLNYMGLRRFSADTLQLRVATGQTVTESVRRDALTNRMAQGLLTYAIDTPAASRVQLSVAEPADGDALTDSPVDDPWNSWVFSVGLSADANGESRRSSSEIEMGMDARRITDEWRFGAEADGNYENERRELSDRTIHIITRNYSANSELVKALAEQWSAGVEGSVGTSTFRNQDLYTRLAPVLEYSFFPYPEFSRRQFTLQYSVGANYFDYTEETLFDKLSERVYDQQLSLALRYQQPWGSARLHVEGSHYLHDLSRYSISGETSISVRLLRGLSAEVGASYSRVHDQLYIQKGDATDEEILLERIALGTNYEYSIRAGLNFTFGSIYNNVVNNRID